MMTPEQLRAVVMASIHAPNAARSDRWTKNWEGARLAKYLRELRAEADLIITAAAAPVDHSELTEPASSDSSRPCEHTAWVLEVDGAWKCSRCGFAAPSSPITADVADSSAPISANPEGR